MKKRKNIIIIAGLLLLILILAGIGLVMANQENARHAAELNKALENQNTAESVGTESAAPEATAFSAPTPGTDSAEADAVTRTDVPAQETAERTQLVTLGAVLVTYGSQQSVLWIDGEEHTYPLYQKTEDGDRLNVIHILPDGVYMESSTCENQDCIEEGEVTFANKGERLLMNKIICLPNQVQLEVYTVEEIRAMAAAAAKPE